MWQEGERCPQSSTFSSEALIMRERKSGNYKQEVFMREIQREKKKKISFLRAEGGQTCSVKLNFSFMEISSMESGDALRRTKKSGRRGGIQKSWQQRRQNGTKVEKGGGKQYDHLLLQCLP